MDAGVLIAQVQTLSLSEEIVQLTIRGLALGAIYALIALGFVIIYKATEVINFAHGALMLFGTHIIFTLVSGQYPRLWPLTDLGQLLAFPTWLDWWTALDIKLRFPLAVALAAVVVAGLGILIERTALRKMIGQPVFAVVLITLGLEVVISTGVQVLWNPQQKGMASPFPPASTLQIGDIAIQWASVWTIIVTAGIVALFFVFFRYSRYGVAIRATAFDQEAAMAMGIKRPPPCSPSPGRSGARWPPSPAGSTSPLRWPDSSPSPRCGSPPSMRSRRRSWEGSTPPTERCSGV